MALLTEHAQQDTLGGGRFRQTIALKRIAFRRDGNLRRITNVLADSGDPALSIGADELVQFRVADRLAGQSPIIHFGRGASNVRLTPLGTNNVAAVVAKNVVAYPGAWDNADLRLSIGGHILRKEILLRAGHPSSFAYRIVNHAGLDIDTLSTPDFRILQPSLEGPNREHIPLVWGISSSGGKYILTCTLPPGDYAGWVVDPTLVLQPDATDGVDTYIRAGPGYPTLNYGLDTVFLVGTGDPEDINRSLLRVVLPELEPGATTVSAVLALQVTSGSDAVSRVVSVHRGLTQWFEGAKNGVAPDAGQDGSTWNLRNANGAVAWGAAGGQSGVDYAAVATASTAITVAAVYTWDVVADVIAWYGGVSNYGWFHIGVESASGTWKACASSDNATAANRPKLTIEYTLPAAGMSRAPIASWCH